MNINLGCGNLKAEGEFGVDSRKTEAVDLIHDLSEYPWPFKDEQFENATAKDIIEHILHVVPFVDECWRIIKPAGNLYIRTSYFMKEQAYTDPTHLHYFALDSFDFFDPSTPLGSNYGWYTDKKWTVVSKAVDGQELIFTLQKGW